MPITNNFTASLSHVPNCGVGFIATESDVTASLRIYDTQFSPYKPDRVFRVMLLNTYLRLGGQEQQHGRCSARSDLPIGGG